MCEIRLANVTRVFAASLEEDARRAGARAEHRDGAGQAAGGKVLALDRVNLTVPHGQTFALVGPSGCGKSTLLRVVAGLDTEYTGHIYYDGRDMRDVPPKDRGIGMVFQSYALYPHFEGEGNLRFTFWVRHAPDAETEERIRVTSEIMGYGFEELLPRKPGTLSGGQQQRLAVARALVRNPRLFLFDEPLSNLDAQLRAQTRVEIKRLLRRFQITAIYVTHDQEEAIALGDQIAVMREGRVEQAGTLDDLREGPINAFVAGFIGRHPMNLLAGTTAADGTLRVGGDAVPLPPSVRARYMPGEKLILGARPEVGRLAGIGRAPARPGDLCLAGEIEVIEPDFVRRTQFVGVRAGAIAFGLFLGIDEHWRTGETVEVVFPADQLYFFDAGSGLRVT